MLVPGFVSLPVLRFLVHYLGTMAAKSVYLARRCEILPGTRGSEWGVTECFPVVLRRRGLP